MILVIGSAVPREGCFAEALALSQQHVRRSRTEAGCVSHAVHQDVENTHHLVFVEEWSDRAALLQHFQLPGSIEFAKALATLSSEQPTIRIYDATEVPLNTQLAT